MSDIQNPQPGAQRISDYQENRPRSTRTGELAASDAHGTYLESVRQGKVWVISTPVAGIVATANMLFSVASSNAIVGLYNPTSDSYAHIQRTVLQLATATAANYVWAVIPPSPLAVVPTGAAARNARDLTTGGNRMVAFNGAVAVSGSAATQFFRVMRNAPTGVGPIAHTESDGDIVVPPGGFAGLYADAAQVVTCWAHLQWEEVPV